MKRGISLKNIKDGKKEPAAGGTVRQVLELQNGISSEMAKDIVKRVKASKIKVAAKSTVMKYESAGKTRMRSRNALPS